MHDGWKRPKCCEPVDAGETQALAVKLAVQTWNVVAGTPKLVHVFPYRGG
jgi:hypothetical protein